MEFGKYRPIKYRISEIYKTYQFTNITQFWLALLSFALFILTLIWDFWWKWWTMLDELSPLGWVALVMGTIFVLVIGFIAIWSFISFLIVVFRGWFGINIHYKKGQLPQNIEASVEPKKYTNKELRKSICNIVKNHESDIDYLVNVLKFIVEQEDKSDNTEK